MPTLNAGRGRPNSLSFASLAVLLACGYHEHVQGGPSQQSARKIHASPKSQDKFPGDKAESLSNIPSNSCVSDVSEANGIWGDLGRFVRTLDIDNADHLGRLQQHLEILGAEVGW